MPKKYVYTEVDGYKLKLSNLDKILYPSVKVTKAQVIKYYLDNAERLLEHIKGRALTVIRYPDGVEGKSFYSKDKPDWTPDWMDSVKIQHEEKSIDYLLPQNKASLVWLANLACLELHPMQFISGTNPFADYFVFDLDPDESLDFEIIKEAAYNLKLFLEQFEYISFIKTSGGKGLHIIVPIIANTPFDNLVDFVKKLTRKFIASHSKLYTLELSKEKRKGKILIDIYRNHKSNTTVAPFSLRGKPGAPISMPFYWDDLGTIKSAKQFTLLNYQSYLDKRGNAWNNWKENARPLHNQTSVQKSGDNNRLTDYIKKRSLSTTPEPAPVISLSEKDSYVIQLHDASNLHYDLRLEDQGVLLSWAIPKSLPFISSQKRLAIRTEDHPIQYLHFEGVIPKGQYGAGRMQIVEKGKIKWIEKKKTSFKFSLSEQKSEYQYHLFQTKNENQWLIKVEVDKQFIHIKHQTKPMLADASDLIPKHPKFKFEVKWDGIRVLVYIEREVIKIVSRNGNDLTDQFPELQHIDCFKIEQGVFDGEIVVLDAHGRPIFSDVISRMHTKGDLAIERLSKRLPVCCYFFDLLALDGNNLVDLDLKKRRAILEMTLKTNQFFRFSESFDDGDALFNAIASKGMEGIMAKDQSSSYIPDSRSRNWLKIKIRQRDICLIIGYTAGKGDRKGLIGALHLAKMKEKLTYLGKVGTGFDHSKLKELSAILTGLNKIEKPIDDIIEKESRTTWIEMKLSCEIQYASMTSNNTYREPVFIKLID